MKKSSNTQGILMEQDIELRMNYEGNTSWYYYVMQWAFIMILSSSSIVCFLSCFDFIEVILIEELIIGIGILSLICVAMFLYSNIQKYLIGASVCLYAIVGYLYFDRIRDGSIEMANAVIEAYNQYFNANVLEFIIFEPAMVMDYSITLLFYLFPIIGVTTYCMMFGKGTLLYTVLTIPIVFIGFIVGKVPNEIAYACYVGGTIGVLAIGMSERGGIFFKTRVHIQMFCFLLTVSVLAISYYIYPPSRYEEEVNVAEMKATIQQTMTDITTGEFFNGTIFENLFESGQEGGNVGLSNGRLGRVGNLRYKNETALRITTQRTDNASSEYIKGYIGEQYTGSSWVVNSNLDKQRLEQFEALYLNGVSVENLPSMLFELLTQSPYNYYDFLLKEMTVENVNASNTVSYMPYLPDDRVTIDNGRLQSDSNRTWYYYIDGSQLPAGKDRLNRMYEHLKMNTILQMNLLNVKVLEQWREKEYYLDNLLDTMRSSIPSIQESSVLSEGGLSSNNYTNIIGFFNRPYTVEEFVELTKQIEDYSTWENWYYKYVTQVYTKLPEGQLDRIYELIEGREVDVDRVYTQGTNYNYVDEIDSYSEFQQLYVSMQQNLQITGEEEWEDNTDYIQSKYYEAIEFVQTYLAQNTTYTLNPGRTPSGEDFVEYFLFENQQGYCMHYASAAAVLLRAMGVPTRYVEGYVVTQNDYNKAVYSERSEVERFAMYTSGTNEVLEVFDEVILDIKDTNAHAWVEVYLPGLGWQPIEMTTPYSIDGSIEVPPVNEDPEATLQPTPQITSTPTPTPSNTPSNSPSIAPTQMPNTQTSAFVGWYEALSARTKRMLHVMVLSIFVVMLLITMVLLRRRVLLYIRKKQEKESTYNETILAQYRRLLPIYEIHKVPLCSGLKKEAFLQAFVTAYPFVNEEGAKHYVDLILKAKYKEGLVTKEELNYVETFHQGFVARVYEDASRLKKWYYKYGLVIL